MDATKDVECYLQSYEIAMRALVCDLKEQRSPLDIDDPNYKYILRELFYGHTIEVFATLQFLERRHELGLSTNLDEAGINSVRFAREVNDYGLLRTRKMWQDIERMKLNDEQHYFVMELYRFVLDLSLDITISDCIYVDHKVMQFRLCDEFLNMTRDHDITNVEEYGCELQNDGNARHRLKNYVSGVLALGESWGDELQRLVEIIMRNYSSEHVSSIFIGSGRISVEFL